MTKLFEIQLPQVEQIEVSLTFTLVTIFVQFETFLTGTVIASWCIFTNMTAAMARIIWIAFVDVCKKYKTKDLRLICSLALLFYVDCFELSDISLLGKTRCRRKRFTAYLPSLKLFLPLPSVEKFAKQANLASHRVFVRVFFTLLFLDVLFNGSI